MSHSRPGLLRLRNCGLESEDLEKICNFSGNGNVRVRFNEIDLSKNARLHWSGSHLGRLLVRIPPCETGSSLTLDGCNLHSEDIQAMLQVIKEESPEGKLNVRRLDLSNNRLTNSGRALAEILQRMPDWSDVTLVSCGLNAYDLQMISKTYASMNIKGLRIDLSENNLSDAGQSVHDILCTEKIFSKLP